MQEPNCDIERCSKKNKDRQNNVVHSLFEPHLCDVPFLRNVGFDGSIIVDVDGHVKHQCEVQQGEQHVHRNPKQILAVGAWR